MFEFLTDKKIAIIGTGVSHHDLIKKFLSIGYDITIFDKRSNPDDFSEYIKLGAKLSIGENYLDSLENYDIIFRTPGMYFNHPALKKARDNGKTVTSELEVFFKLNRAQTFAVTGSDGKTTTTNIIAKILETENKKVHLGGNLGRALLPIIDDIRDTDNVVAELSSFQLMSMRTPFDTTVITNITPNHLDVHGEMGEYIDCKKQIFLHQDAFSRTILSADNEIVNRFSEEIRGKLIKFSIKEKPMPFGAFLREDGILCYNNNGEIVEYLHMEDIKIRGIHNVENYLAAIAATFDFVSPKSVCEVAKTFNGVEHRIEFVREIDGVKYYNDSIATSPTRVIAGLKAFGRKIIIISGGYDKKIPYEPLGEPVNKYVKCLVTLGATAEKIENAVKNSDYYNAENIKILRTENLEEAVKTARKNAVSGDIISLSPASASFDLYKNFEERGKHFKNIVNALK
ncbi:MAG: UDP-N-acetylmuramoyl-L-alanine--D-glutamate ligase [Ruminococcus sp.]|jgi:UDP-N-acetylmuramoylalanine--D-glutamate ligase|nr:UDP-N-acetylmuramoyl-L-alanine--D-glutamate ligase [Ruminococcus sp.]